jgi:hypothetical protein
LYGKLAGMCTWPCDAGVPCPAAASGEYGAIGTGCIIDGDVVGRCICAVG